MEEKGGGGLAYYCLFSACVCARGLDALFYYYRSCFQMFYSVWSRACTTFCLYSA